MNHLSAKCGCGFFATVLIAVSLFPLASIGQDNSQTANQTKKFRYPVELQAFVNPTGLCDSENSEIKAKATQLTVDCQSPTDAAVKLFYFVRDECLFGLSEADQKASVTLNTRVGWCVTKNNLLVAMLRSVGIPARYHQVSVNRTSLKGIVSSMLYKMVPKVITIHPWCECYLDGRWLACDVTFDKQTYRAAIAKGFFTRGNMPSIDWDGRTDSKCISAFVLEDHGVHQSYDDISRNVAETNRKMGPMFLLRAITNSSNRKTARLREKYSIND